MCCSVLSTAAVLSAQAMLCCAVLVGVVWSGAHACLAGADIHETLM